MALDQYEFDELTTERQSIAKLGRLHWFHWAVVGLSLAITVGAWFFVKQQIEDETRTRFQSAAEQVLELASERMQKYEDGLWGGVAAIQAQGGDISHEDWRQFAQSLQIEAKYPGINGIGVIHRIRPEGLDAYLENQRRSRPDYHLHPKHNKSEYLPITYIEPSNENVEAIGLDMVHEINRYSAALKARDTGLAQITGPIVLVQDAERTPGFLFYAPFYSGGTYESLEDRRDHFVGMVYAPFVFHKLIEGVLSKDRRQVRIRIKDGADILYDEHVKTDQEHDQDPLFKTKVDLDIYGRTWSFDIASTKTFRKEGVNDQPVIILLGGIIIDSLLLTLFILLSRANRRAVDFADRVADRLTHESTEHLRLADENAKKELQLFEERAAAEALEMSLRKEREKSVLQRKFVSMVSHEFRTPLTVIDGYAERILKRQEQLSPEAIANIQLKIQSAVQRLVVLIERMLASARLEAGAISFSPNWFNLSELIENICSQQDEISPAHRINLDLTDIPEKFFGDEKLLHQAFSNLLSNAVKYSPNAESVDISGKRTNGHICIDVCDYGLGVPEAEIPELFTNCFRASTSEGIAGTGVGLYLVQAFVGLHDGEVIVRSCVGEGSTFTIRLPLAAVDAPVTLHEAIA